MDKQGKLLIIDDNEDVLFALHALLTPHVEKIKVSAQPEKIEHYLQTFHPDLILLDMNFRKDMVSGQEGFYWLKKILQIDPEALVLFMTAYADTEKAVQAIKAGAIDFIPKPWEREKLLATVHAALRLKASRKEIHILKGQVQALNTGSAPQIIGRSPAMERIFELVDKVSATEANLLLLGENGTGKDLIARTIHCRSDRANGLFVGIDLGSIAESLFESELFGYEKGAFTDARKEKQGRMEIASGGTLFLDEIANLSAAMQAKMLTAIEKRTISRLGSTRDIPIDVRLVSATNADIHRAVEEGRFRQDLLYRINTIELHIPPLRQRGEDILLLAEHFLEKFRQKYKKEIHGIDAVAQRKLLSYPWPGNVRELQNAVERAVILSSGDMLRTEDFILTHRDIREVGSVSKEQILNLELLEQHAIEEALKRSDGNLNKAAELLGISRFSLYRKINKK